jgi:hypothetical protein
MAGAMVFVGNERLPDYHVAQTPLEGPCSIADVQEAVKQGVANREQKLNVYFIDKLTMCDIDRSLRQDHLDAYLFTPKISTLVGLPRQRIAALGAAIDRANAAGCDIFLRPEYFCAATVSKLAMGSGMNHC